MLILNINDNSQKCYKGHITFEKVNLNHTYYFFNDIKNIDLNLLNINKTYAKNTDTVIYEIKYITMQIINNQNIDIGIPLCLSLSDLDAYVIEENEMKNENENENKYLIFALTENNKEVLELYKTFWSEIKKQIKATNSGGSIKYKTDFMKVRLDSYDDLPLNKMLCFSVLDVIVESVFQIENEYYPQIHINECEHECDY